MQSSNQKWRKTVKQDGSQKVIWRETSQKRGSIFRVAASPLSFPFSALLASQGFGTHIFLCFLGPMHVFPFFHILDFYGGLLRRGVASHPIHPLDPSQSNLTHFLPSIASILKTKPLTPFVYKNPFITLNKQGE